MARNRSRRQKDKDPSDKIPCSSDILLSQLIFQPPYNEWLWANLADIKEQKFRQYCLMNNLNTIDYLREKGY